MICKIHFQIQIFTNKVLQSDKPHISDFKHFFLNQKWDDKDIKNCFNLKHIPNCLNFLDFFKAH